MGLKRRDFLRLTGLAAAGLGAASAFDLWPIGPIETLAGEAQGTFSEGKRYAMIVILPKLSEADAKAAVEACHRVHNVPDIRNPDGKVNQKEEIKWIWVENFEHTFTDDASEFPSETAEHQPFLVLCNHCTNPSCVRVCPTKATFKRPKDGIVAMDMHRCIGCRFCMAACPYGSRSFNWSDPRPFIKVNNPTYPTRSKGVVEKCNFCEERLAKGQRPACVEAVKSGALAFGDLSTPSSEVRELLRKHQAFRRKPSLGTNPNVYYII